MTNYIISRIAGAVAMFGAFCMMMGFLGALLSTSSVFVALAVGGLVTVGVCRLFMIEE
jgi:hypothetical protein